MAIDKDAAGKPAGDEKLLNEGKEDAETDQPEGDEADADEADDQEDAEGDASEEEGEKAESDEDGGDKKLSKASKRRARDRAKIATLEEIARHESQRADQASAAADRLKALEAEVGKEPKESDYEGRPNDYIADRAAWKADMAAAARAKKTAESDNQQAQKSAGESKLNLFRERVRALSESHPGIEARVFDQTAPFNRTMADVLMDSDRGAEVADYLASHREEAVRIQQMTPLLAARELGRLEAKIDAPKPRTQTQAPKPVPKVGGNGAKASKDPDKMTVEEWKLYRNAQLGLDEKGFPLPRRKAN